MLTLRSQVSQLMSVCGMSSVICQHSTKDKILKQLLNLVLCCMILCCSASIGIALVIPQYNSWVAVQCLYTEPSERMWSSLLPWVR